MGIVNIFLIIIMMVIIPFAIGLLFEPCFATAGERKSDESLIQKLGFVGFKSSDSIVFSRCFVTGFAALLAFFQIIAVPMIERGFSFTSLLYVYVAVVCLVTALSIALNFKTIIPRIKKSINGIANRLVKMDRFYLMIGVAALLVIAYQTSLLLLKMHTDTDDCRFLAEALEAIERNTLLRVHPITGEALDYPIGEMTKEITSPYPLLIAVFSVLTKLHPTVLAHVGIPALLVPLCYSVAYLFGTHIFEDINKRFVYMFILSVIVLFSFESIYTWGYTLLTIIWQGRSISAVIMLPFLWYVYMKIYVTDKADRINTGLYIMALVVALANACLSGMGAIMAPLVGGSFAASDFIRNKRFVPAVIIVLTVIPAGVCILKYGGF